MASEAGHDYYFNQSGYTHRDDCRLCLELVVPILEACKAEEESKRTLREDAAHQRELERRSGCYEESE